MQLVERQARRLCCSETSGQRDQKQTLWNLAGAAPPGVWGAVEKVPPKRLSLAPVSIKDATLSTTLKDTKERSMFARVSVFSPCLLKLSIGWLPNVVPHTNIDRTQRCLLNPGWGSQWLKLSTEDPQTPGTLLNSLRTLTEWKRKALSGLKGTIHRHWLLCLLGKDRIFLSLSFFSFSVSICVEARASNRLSKRSAPELWFAESRVCLWFFWRRGGEGYV